MYAVVQIGGHQFKVAEGDTIDAYKLDAEQGKDISLDQVLLYAQGDDVRIGQPFLKDVKIKAKVVKNHLGPKVISFKFTRRKDFSKTKGQRQKLTALQIVKIQA